MPLAPSRAVPAVCVLASALVAGCNLLDPAGLGAEPAEARQSQTLRLEERTVERPDAFAMQARALWDGRPSIGPSNWVAVPGKRPPEQVRVTNTANERVAVAALFSKGDSIPGPAILVSDGIARSLGMEPGVPVELKLVALRTETVPVGPEPGEAPVAAAEEPAEEPAPEPAPGPVAAAPDPDAAALTLATIAAATAAAEKAAAEDAAARKAAEEAAAQAAAEAAAAAAAEAEAAAAEAAEAAAAETAAGAAALTEAAAGAPAALEPSRAPAPASLETTVLAALEAAEAESAAAPEAPYVEVASNLGAEAAGQTQAQLSKLGIRTELRSRSGGTTVVAGPAPSLAAQAEILRKVRLLGYQEAKAVQ